MLSGLIEAPQLTRAAAELAERAAEVLSRSFGTPFCFYNLHSFDPIPTEAGCKFPAAVVDSLGEIAQTAVRDAHVYVRRISHLLQALVIPLGTGEEPEIVAIGVFAIRPVAGAADERELADWFGSDELPAQIQFCQPELLRQMGQRALAAIAEARESRARKAEIEQLAAQVSRNYEEITLLHQLTREAQVLQGTRTVQELALSLLADMLPVCQIAYVHSAEDAALSVGGTVLDPRRCRELVNRLSGRALKRPLVENHVSSQAWSPEFDGLDRFILVPVAGRNEHYGWLLAINTLDGSELGSVEASLLTAVAAILATHQTNVKLFEQIEELFLGVVRALSSAIDAKDPYTCGHSERVGQVARRLGQELGLASEELNRLYLSGLLHDVGKLGVPDSVLLKPSRLTEAEFEDIKRHPKIGFEILSRVRQLASVLPGVRHHHESMDGTGYPDGLKGEEIPLMARIMAVADSFDAISSNRPYRKGMSKEQTERIFQEGTGKQWDSRVVQAFLDVHEEVRGMLGLSTEQSPSSLPGEPPRVPQDTHPDQSDLRQISKLFTQALT